MSLESALRLEDAEAWFGLVNTPDGYKTHIMDIIFPLRYVHAARPVLDAVKAAFPQFGCTLVLGHHEGERWQFWTHVPDDEHRQSEQDRMAKVFITAFRAATDPKRVDPVWVERIETDGAA